MAKYTSGDIDRARKARGRRPQKGNQPKGGLYDWGDGKGRVHSRPKRTAAQLGKAKDRKRLSDPAYFTQPMTLGQALTEGNRVADLTYQPQIAQVQLQQRQVPAWFAQYKQSLQTPQQVQQTYQPMIQQQQQLAQDTGKPTQGVDPNSEAGGQDAQAAAARAALQNLGLSTLQQGQAADTTYFQGRQGVADAAQIGLNAQLANQLGSLQGQRGAAVAQYVSDARNAERQFGLDTQHQNVENKAFNVNTAEKVANIKTDRLKIRQTAKENRRKRREKGQEVNKYGYSNEQWARFSPSHRQRIMRRQDSSSSSGSSSGKKPYSDTQHLNAKKDLRKSIALVRQGLDQPSGRDPGYWKQAFNQLVADGIDPAIARAAIQTVKSGKVGPHTKKTLANDYGIKRVGRHKKRPAPGTSSGGGGGPHGSGRP